MAKGKNLPKKEAKKKKKNLFKKNPNGRITTAKAAYDNNLVGANPSPVRVGY